MMISDGSGMQADWMAMSRAMPRVSAGGDDGNDEGGKGGDDFLGHAGAVYRDETGSQMR